MLTIRKFMAACALAHDKDCSHEGWEYDGAGYEDWFEDVIGISAIPGRCEISVYLLDKKGTEVTVVSLPTAEVDAAADLVGYLDMF